MGRIQPLRLWKPCAMRVPGLQKMLERRNMQHPTMLVVVGQRCWVRLHGAKAAVNTRHTLPGPTDCY